MPPLYRCYDVIVLPLPSTTPWPKDTLSSVKTLPLLLRMSAYSLSSSRAVNIVDALLLWPYLLVWEFSFTWLGRRLK